MPGARVCVLTPVPQAGANVNHADQRNSLTPAMLAAATNIIALLEALVHAGADLSLRSSSGRTALQLAREGRCEEAVACLECIDTAAGAAAAMRPVKCPRLTAVDDNHAAATAGSSASDSNSDFSADDEFAVHDAMLGFSEYLCFDWAGLRGSEAEAVIQVRAYAAGSEGGAGL
jgi:hypothetical protein